MHSFWKKHRFGFDDSGMGGGGSGCPCGSSENDCIGHVSCLLIKKALS